jgi:hypothetical protein
MESGCSAAGPSSVQATILVWNDTLSIANPRCSCAVQSAEVGIEILDLGAVHGPAIAASMPPPSVLPPLFLLTDGKPGGAPVSRAENRDKSRN